MRNGGEPAMSRACYNSGMTWGEWFSVPPHSGSGAQVVGVKLPWKDTVMAKVDGADHVS